MDNYKELVCRLRTLGLVMNREMNIVTGKNHRQFMVAFIVSPTEIEEKSFHAVLNDAETQFYSSPYGFTDASKRYFRLRRLIFLMNFKDSLQRDQHTEARLLDPTGKILDQLKGNGQEERKVVEVRDSDFLGCLKRDFIAEFGTDESYSIAIFSYFLPCTQPDHVCAKLIGAYAERTKTNIILSYEMPFKTTDKQSSLDSMRCEKIKIIHPGKWDNFVVEQSFCYPLIQRQYGKGFMPVCGMIHTSHGISLPGSFFGRSRYVEAPYNIVFPHIPCTDTRSVYMFFSLLFLQKLFSYQSFN